MALKAWQTGLLHAAPAALGVDDRQRRLVQRNVGGAWSAADMDFPAFVAVMAFWERCGWRDRRREARFWRRLAARGDLLGLESKALKLASLAGWTRDDGHVDFRRLDGFVQRQTDGRRRSLRQCDREDLYQVIEGLKALGGRRTA